MANKYMNTYSYLLITWKNANQNSHSIGDVRRGSESGNEQKYSKTLILI